MMRYAERRLPAAIVPFLLGAALLGYLAGHSGGHSSAQPSAPQALRTVAAANVVVGYPAGWSVASAAPAIPGLAIGHPLALSPAGNPSRAGLLVGTLPAGEPSPLPSAFVASLRQTPETEVVDLSEIEAYRYAQLRVPGYAAALRVFVVPNPGGEPTAMACYAPAASSAEMHTCEQTVATATLVGQPPTYGLVPEPAYARKVSEAIAALDRLRATLGRELHTQTTATSVQSAATRLAGGFADAADSLSGIEAPPSAAQAQAALSESVQRARDAYTAVARAAGARSPSAFAGARSQASAAETEVNRVLETFSLLGYGSGPSGDTQRS